MEAVGGGLGTLGARVSVFTETCNSFCSNIYILS